jgi:mRNA interferase MazF
MKRGTVVLTPFPFTDLTGRKVRPALVVSRSDRPGSDVILAFISTYRGQVLLTTDLLVEASHAEFGTTGLKTSSVVKLDKLVTVEASVVLGELGELPAELMQQVTDKLRYSLDL